MARALMGHVGSPGEQLLAIEVGRLRRRVRELEAELTQLREQSGVVADTELNLELRRIAEPVLA